jgi:transposase, IS30 family
LKRNTYQNAELPQYSSSYAVTAQDRYERRRTVHRKLVAHPDVKAAIEYALNAGWSPEQIPGRMRLEQHRICVSHGTIYRFAYSKAGLEQAFYRHLPEHRRRRRPRTHRRHQRSHIQASQSLCHRPSAVAERQEFGHWECDLMMFRKETAR